MADLPLDAISHSGGSFVSRSRPAVHFICRPHTHCLSIHTRIAGMILCPVIAGRRVSVHLQDLEVASARAETPLLLRGSIAQTGGGSERDCNGQHLSDRSQNRKSLLLFLFFTPFQCCFCCRTERKESTQTLLARRVRINGQCTCWTGR